MSLKSGGCGALPDFHHTAPVVVILPSRPHTLYISIDKIQVPHSRSGCELLYGGRLVEPFSQSVNVS